MNIVVAGGGNVGLAMALALVHSVPRSVTVQLLDRQPLSPGTPGDSDPRATAVSAAAANLLRHVGVWPRLAEAAQLVTRIDLTDPIGDSPLRQVLLSYDNTLDAVGDDPESRPASWIVANADLRDALLEAVLAHPAIEVFPPAAVTGLTSSPALATVALAGGAQMSAQLVIAADGARSRLRTAAGIRVTSWDYGQTAIVATVCHERPHEGVATQHFLPAGPFAILPLVGNRSSIVWSEQAGEAARIMSLDDTGFLSALKDRFGTRYGALELQGTRHAWPLHLQLARSMTAPRLALIGDAARSVHPLAGQGLNLAMRDIAALAQVIADTVMLGGDPGSAAVLERYTAWRRFDSTASALAYDALNRLFSNNNALLRAARDAGLGLVSRAPALKALLVREAAGVTGELPELLRPQPASPAPPPPLEPGLNHGT